MNRRTSVYTIRLQTAAAVSSVAQTLRDAGQPVTDLGEASVSFRTTDDANALQIARGATYPTAVPYELTTGLGVHRRTVQP